MKIKTPKYRSQRTQSGDLGFVELSGKRHYFGKYDSSESIIKQAEVSSACV